MFQPVFVYDGSHASQYILPEYAERKGFRLLDIQDATASIPVDNPAMVVYDGDGFMRDRVYEGGKRFTPPKHTGVMTMHGTCKGHVHGLANPKAFIEWFFGKEVSYWNPLTGNFRIANHQFVKT